VELDRRSVRRLRDDALLAGALPDALEEKCPTKEERARLVAAYLCLLDRFWADHLLLVEEVREGIDLERFAGRDPGLEYIHRIGGAFEAGLVEIEGTLIEAYILSREDPDALSLEGMGLARPSSTWTYQIDDEVPVRFNLSLIGGSQIAAGLAAAPYVVLAVVTAGVALIKAIFRRREEGRCSRRRASRPDPPKRSF
jgi:hypothetical protein